MAFEHSSSQRYGKFYRNVQKYASRREVLISSYIILSLFTVSFFAAVFIRPTAVKIALLWKEIQDKRTVYSQLEKKISDLEKAQELLASVEDKLIYLQLSLPQESLLQRFMQTIEYLASSNNLVLSSGTYPSTTLYPASESSSSSSLISYPFEITLKGTTKQFLSFIKALEKFDRFIKISKVKISLEEKTEKGQEFTLIFFIGSEIYSYPVPEED